MKIKQFTKIKVLDMCAGAQAVELEINLWFQLIDFCLWELYLLDMNAKGLLLFN